jgi:hypothetical protein
MYHREDGDFGKEIIDEIHKYIVLSKCYPAKENSWIF